MKLPTWLKNVTSSVRDFDEDERGDVVQNLLILAIAAVILLIFWKFLWPPLYKWVSKQKDEVIKIEPTE